MKLRYILSGVLVFVIFAAQTALGQDEVRIGVFGLFHPFELIVRSQYGHALSVSSVATRISLTGERYHQEVRFRADHGRVVVGNSSAAEWVVQAREKGPGRIQLIVPGKISRNFTGKLTITAHHNELIAVISMDREKAVASIVAAEMPTDAPIEALKAQAVVTRSFLAAGRRHTEFDFCDTTHCQYLRSIDEVTERVAAAVASTNGVVLTYRQHAIAAMYSSRCGGTTQSLRDAGADPGIGYPYYRVECAWCRRHPFRWKSRVDSTAVTPDAGNEAHRMTLARLWGWSAVPGNRFSTERESSGTLLIGQNHGHGIGMCQMGAIAMARSGVDYRAILAHYYPNAELAEVQ